MFPDLFRVGLFIYFYINSFKVNYRNKKSRKPSPIENPQLFYNAGDGT